jgi:hypothetical protein
LVGFIHWPKFISKTMNKRKKEEDNNEILKEIKVIPTKEYFGLKKETIRHTT